VLPSRQAQVELETSAQQQGAPRNSQHLQAGGGVSWGPPRPVCNIPNIVRLPGRNTSRHTSKLQPYGGQRPNAELDESAVENYAPAFKTPPPHHHTTLKVPSGWDDHQWHLYSSHVQRYRPPIHGTHAALMSQHVVSTLRAH
jgi:hypothetical protein